MRQGPQIKRQRGRGQGGYQGGNQGNSGGGGNNRKPGSLRHQTFDSNGPDTRVRGTAIQVYEKYMSLARDATSSGDRVMAENYYQHAEHYYRIIASFSDGQPYIPQHMQQRDALDFEQDEDRGQPQQNGPDEALLSDPASPDAPQPDMAATEQPRFDDRRDGDRRDRREFRDRRNDRESFRPDLRGEGRNDTRPDQGEFNEQPAFLRQPARRPREENEPRDNRRFDGEGRQEGRNRTRHPAYQQGYEPQPDLVSPSPVTVITPAGGGLPLRVETAPSAEAPPPAPEPIAPPPVTVEAPAPIVIVPIAVTEEASLPLGLPVAEAVPEAPAEPPKRKRGRPPKAKPPVDA